MLAKRNRPYSSRAEASIRRGYEVILDYSARLTAFASSPPIVSETDVEERQKFLASNDLLAFALHVRRFAADTNSASLLRSKKLKIPKLKRTGKIEYDGAVVETSFQKILNEIIHNTSIEIARNELDLRVGSIDFERDWRMVSVWRKKAIPTKVFVRNESGAVLVVDLCEFMNLFLEEIFQSITDECAENSIFLQQSIYG